MDVGIRADRLDLSHDGGLALPKPTTESAASSPARDYGMTATATVVSGSGPDAVRVGLGHRRTRGPPPSRTR